MATDCLTEQLRKVISDSMSSKESVTEIRQIRDPLARAELEKLKSLWPETGYNRFLQSLRPDVTAEEIRFLIKLDTSET